MKSRRRAKRFRRLALESLEDRSLLAFTPGNILVYRVGTGSGSLGTNAAQVFLDEFDPNDLGGAPVQSIALPTTTVGSQRALTARGNGAAEGLLTLSADGRYVFFTGYEAAPGTSTNGTNRVVGRIDFDGNLDTSTYVTGVFTSGINGVASSDGNDIWLAGAGTGGGVRHTTFGAAGASTLISNTAASPRALDIVGGQLYVTANDGGIKLGTVGTGTPTLGGQTITNLPGIPSGGFPVQPYQFFFADLDAGVAGADTLYIADETNGLRKFSLVGATWQIKGTLSTNTLRGLTGVVDGSTVTLYATTTAANDNELLRIRDTGGYNAPFTAVTQGIFAGAPNQVMRGVALVPLAGSDPDPEISGNGNNNSIEVSRSGDNLVVRVDGLEVLNQALADTQSLSIDGGGGNDRMIVDYSVGGYFDLPITLEGGSQSGTPGDEVVVRGGNFATVRHNFTGPGAGNIDLDNDGVAEIVYSGLEPLLMTSGIADLVLDLVPPAIGDAVIRDYSGPGDVGHSEIAFTAASLESFQFTPPTSSLSVLTNGGSTVALQGFDPVFATPHLRFEDTSGTTSDFVLQAGERVPDGSRLSVLGNARLDLNGFSETVATLEGSGTIDNLSATAATIAVGFGGASSTFSGALQDTGAALALKKVGGGTFNLAGTSTHAGLTEVLGGRLFVDGSIAASAAVYADALLGGTGTIGGNVAVHADGTVTAGSETTAALLSISGNLELNDGIYLANILGSAGDRLAVGGGIDLMSPAPGVLTLASSGVVPAGTAFTLIDNLGGAPIADAPFSGAPQAGSELVGANNIRGYYSYSGGDGDDFTFVIASSDPTCDGVDDDADGSTDEDFVPTTGSTSATTCIGGVLVTSPLADWGDAPTAAQSGFAASYPSLAADNGAAHTATGPRLGAARDIDTDGQPDTAAAGDDLSGSPDDEDGVALLSPLTPGLTANVRIDVQNAPLGARLDAWFDFNQDGVWDDAPLSPERIFSSEPLAPGFNVVNFAVPTTAATGASFARFRLSTAGGLGPQGAASDGEVEDYRLLITPPATTSVALVGLDVIITDIAGGDTNDRLTISKEGTNLRISDPDNVLSAGPGATALDDHTVEIPLVDIVGGIQVDTLGGDDLLTLVETASGLPPLGGVAGGRASATFAALTSYDQSAGAAVSLHYDGGSGDDALAVVLTQQHAVVYTSDALGGAASGNVGIGSGGAFPLFGARQFGISFENLSPLSFSGSGGTLVVDASSSPATDVTSLTIDDFALAGDGVSAVHPNAGSTTFEPVSFSGFTGLVVRSGGAADTIDLIGLDSAAAITEIALDGDSAAGGDVSPDVLRVQSTSGVAARVSLLGGPGDDVFQVQQLGGALSIDGIAGQVVVSPHLGPLLDDPAGADIDRLIVRDDGDMDADLVALSESSFSGLTSYSGAGPQIEFFGIDLVDVAATAGENVLDIAIDSGSDLDAVTVDGLAGNDTFFLDLDTADDAVNSIPGLLQVTLRGGAGGDTFGETPAEAPHQGTGLPSLPVPPQPLPAPTFPLGKGKIRPSRTTQIVLVGGPADHVSSGASPAGNSTAGNVYGPAFDLVNIDLTDRRHPTNPVAPGDAQDSYAVISTVGGTASLLDNDAGESFRAIEFQGMEAINACDQGRLVNLGLGDLYLRMTALGDTVQFANTAVAGIFRTRLNNQFVNLAAATRIVVYGGGGNDYLQMTTATLANKAPLAVEFYGEAGDDYLAGYTGDDLLVGGTGRDRLLAGEGNNELWGDNIGEETSLDGIDQLTAGSGADRAYGGGAGDTIQLGAGNDYAHGGGGNDQIDGQGGDDRVYGAGGDDVLSGGDGNDLLAGNEGRDRLYGRAGHDVILGGDQADQLSGDEGSDLLFDGTTSYDDVATPLAAGGDVSTARGDTADLAMAALLADWALDFAVNAAFLGIANDAFIDTLYGGTGSDSAYRQGAGPSRDSTSDTETLLS